MQLIDKIKINEKSVLETFQEEIPSIYYSDKTEKEYKKFKENFEYRYRYLYKFPPDMFRDKNLIDFAQEQENVQFVMQIGEQNVPWLK